MTKSEIPKFKNELTHYRHGVQQEQNFVTVAVGQNGNQYCIHCDGSLF